MPEARRWSSYWDSTQPNSQPVAFRGARRRRPLAQFSSEAAVRAALPHLATVAPGDCCGETRAAQLIGTMVQGKIAVVVESGDSDCLVVTRLTLKPVMDSRAPGGVAFWLYDRDAVMGYWCRLGVNLRATFVVFHTIDATGSRRLCDGVTRDDGSSARPTGRLPRRGIEADGLAFYAALGSEFAPSRAAKDAAQAAGLGFTDSGRTGLGPCALAGLLGRFTVAQMMSGISFVNRLEGSETVFERFRAVVDGDEEFPEADDDDADAVAARDVAVAIAARIADRGRMTTSADPVLSAQHHELVKDELFAFARYLYEEIESHTSVNITFDESVWDYT